MTANRGSGLRILTLLILFATVAPSSGCRLFERWNKDRDREKDRAIGNPTGRERDRDRGLDREPEDPNSPSRNWLDPPVAPRSRDGGGAETRRPDSRDTRDSNISRTASSQRVISGVLEDEAGKRIADGYISIVPYQAGSRGADVGVKTDEYGYFVFPGLKPGQTYILSADFKIGGRALAAQQYVKVPNQTVKLTMKENLALAPLRPDGESAGAGAGAASRTDLPPGIPSGGGGGVRIPSVFDSSPTGNPNTGAGGAGPNLHFPSENTNGAPWSPVESPPGNRGAPTRPELFAPNGNGNDWNGSPPANIPPPMTPGTTSRVDKSSQIQLVSAAGKPRTFGRGESDYLLLDFMTTNCAPCKRLVPQLKSLQSQYRPEEFEVIGVVCDHVSSERKQTLASAYQDELQLNYGLYVEPRETQNLQTRFQVDRYPTLVLLDRENRILFRGTGADLTRVKKILSERLNDRSPARTESPAPRADDRPLTRPDDRPPLPVDSRPGSASGTPSPLSPSENRPDLPPR